MAESFPDHVPLNRLIRPDETSEPRSIDVLVFDRMLDAWRHAAEQVLKSPDEPHLGGDRAEVARDLLDGEDYYVLHGWQVSRWAKTVRHPITTMHQLSKKWANGITLRHHDAMDDTWSKVSSLLVNDLLTYTDFAGVDVAVIRDRQVILGIVVDCTPGGHITFADGEVIDLDQCEQISAHFG
jgi:hypothetical protein